MIGRGGAHTIFRIIVPVDNLRKASKMNRPAMKKTALAASVLCVALTSCGDRIRRSKMRIPRALGRRWMRPLRARKRIVSARVEDHDIQAIPGIFHLPKHFSAEVANRFAHLHLVCVDNLDGLKVRNRSQRFRHIPAWLGGILGGA